MKDWWREKHHWAAPVDHLRASLSWRKHSPNASERETQRKTHHFVLHLDSISSSRWGAALGKSTCNLYRMCIVNASVLNELSRYLQVSPSSVYRNEFDDVFCLCKHGNDFFHRKRQQVSSVDAAGLKYKFISCIAERISLLSNQQEGTFTKFLEEIYSFDRRCVFQCYGWSNFATFSGIFWDLMTESLHLWNNAGHHQGGLALDLVSK